MFTRSERFRRPSASEKLVQCLNVAHPRLVASSLALLPKRTQQYNAVGAIDLSKPRIVA